MAAVKDFEDLAIFQKARELSKKVYQVTKNERHRVKPFHPLEQLKPFKHLKLFMQ